MNGFPGGPPPRLALSLGDSLAGMFAAQGALAALYRRTVTGEGQVVDAALTESCLAVQESTIPDYDVGGVVRGPSGTRLEGIAPSNIYPTADGSWVVIAANQDTVFRRLCAAMGQPELATDDRFANHVARGRNQDELDKIIGDWAAERQPADIIATLSRGRGDQRTDQHRRRGRERSAAAGPRHDRRPLGRTDRTKRQGPRRGAGAVGDAREPSATPGPARPGQHNDEIYRELLGTHRRRARRAAGGGRDLTELPTHVDIRDVSLRDGLQIEDPIPLSAKLELLAAVAATGVREMEATAFVSPSKVPALADAAELAAELHRLRLAGIEFSALVASPNGAKRAIAAGLHSIEYVVSAADGHSRSNVGRSTAEATALIAEIVAHRARQRRLGRGHHRHRMGLPVRRPDTAAAGRRRRDSGLRGRRRPAGDRRHHRHDHAAAGQRPDRAGPPADRRHPARRALPQHPRGRSGQRLRRGELPVSPGSTPRSAGSAAARSRRAPAATSPPRISSTCCGTAESTSMSTCRPRSPRRKWRSASSAMTCRARCCAPATASSARSRARRDAQRQGPPDPGSHRAGRPEAVRRARLSRHDAGRHHVGGGQVARGVLPLLRRQGGPAGRAGRVVPARHRRPRRG